MRLSPAARSSALYAVASVLGKSSGLALIPLYAIALSFAEIGCWAELSAIRVVAAAALGFAIDGYLTQTLHRQPPDRRVAHAQACAAACLRLNLPLAGVLGLGMALLPAWRDIAAILISAQAAALANVVSTGWRMCERPGLYAAASSAIGLLSVILTWSLVLSGYGVWGLIIGTGAPNLAFAAWVRGAELRGCLPEGLAPYVVRMLPTRVVGEVGGQVDRLVLSLAVSDAALGVYDLALRVAGALGLVASSLKATLLPQSLRRLADGEGAAAIERPLLDAFLVCSACAGITLAGGGLAAASMPDAPWAASLTYLPGALLVQLWSVVWLTSGISLYHKQLLRSQAIYALIVVGLSAGALALGSQHGMLAAQAGYLLVAATLPTLMQAHLARRHPTLPRSRLLVLAAWATMPIFALAWAPPTWHVVCGVAWSAMAAMGLAASRRRTDRG